MDFCSEELAHFYIHSEVPTDDTLYHNYYRLTDYDAVSVLLPGHYRETLFEKS